MWETLIDKISKELVNLGGKLEFTEKYLIELIKSLAAQTPSSKELENMILHIIELAFGPKQIFYQFLLVTGLQCFTSVYESCRYLTSHIIMSLTIQGRKKLLLLSNLSKAKNYYDWKSTATQLDILEGNDIWQDTDSSSFYDYRVIRKRITDLIQMIHYGDVFNLIFRLRGGLGRDQFGVMHEALFSKAKAGTKVGCCIYMCRYIRMCYLILQFSSYTICIDYNRELSRHRDRSPKLHMRLPN